VKAVIDENHEVRFYDSEGNECAVATHPVHEFRWWGLTAWIVVFTIVVILLGASNRHAIHDLKEQKASVASLKNTNIVLAKTIEGLKKTNLSLQKFLITACVARANAAKEETGLQRANDIRAAKGYKQLADLFPKQAETPTCKIPSK